MQEFEQTEEIFETEPESKTKKAGKGLNKIIAVLIILAVAAFGDVMYIVLMSNKFPAGLLLGMCYIGAFTSFGAIGYLLLGKTLSFTPGKQMLASWIVFVGELTIIALNIILVFELGSSLSNIMQVWFQVSPATPVFHMIGVALVFFLDEDLEEKHKDLEMRSQVKKANRAYKLMLHKTAMRVKVKQLKFMETALLEATQGADVHSFLGHYGHAMNANLLEDLTGMHFASHALPNARTVDAQPQINRTTAATDPDIEKMYTDKKGNRLLGQFFHPRKKNPPQQKEPKENQPTKTVRVTRAAVEVHARNRQLERSRTDERRKARLNRLHTKPSTTSQEPVTEQLPPTEQAKKTRKKKAAVKQGED